MDSLIDGTDPMLQRFGIETGGPLPDPSILDPLIAGTDPLWLEIQKEADAFIGADGVPSYIAENSNVEVLPLDLGRNRRRFCQRYRVNIRRFVNRRRRGRFRRLPSNVRRSGWRHCRRRNSRRHSALSAGRTRRHSRQHSGGRIELRGRITGRGAGRGLGSRTDDDEPI